MVFSELKEKINKEIGSGDFSLQAIFNRNIVAIEHLKSEGYSYKKIFDKLNTRLHESHFRDLVRRAKKQRFPESTRIEKKQDNSLNTPKTIVNVNQENTSIEEWIDSLGYEISERVYNKIINLNITIDEIESFKIPNERRLLILLNELKQKRKFK